MQQTIFSIMKQDYKITKPIRLIEMFGGIGSQAKALINLSKDFSHYKLIEIDNYCILSYNAIHGTNFQPQDVTKIKGKDLEIVEKDKYEYIMTYSFPCQDLSLAGKQKGMAKDSGTRSALLWEVERILRELKESKQLPQILLMENVPQVVGKANFKDFREWEIFLEGLGYSNYFQLLNAKDYGIPQNRNRCFMVSILGNFYYRFPPKQKLKLRLKDFLEDEVDEKYCLSEKMISRLVKQKSEMGGKDQQYREPKIILKSKNKRLKSIINKIDFNANEPLNLDLYNQSISKISQTLTMPNHNSQALYNNYCIRKFTPKECWRLMGFSDEDYEKASKVCSNTQLYKQAGNSIVVNVLMEIFRRFYD